MSERGQPGNYYTAPINIKSVPNLVTKTDEARCDVYSGSAEAMIAAGLLSADMFPGQPGRNVASQAYRPSGVERIKGETWTRVPGYLFVARAPSGKFQIRLTVSREEQARRMEKHRAEVNQRPQTPSPVTSERREEIARTLLETIIESMGFKEVQRLLDDARPRRTAPRPKHLQLVAWSQ